VHGTDVVRSPLAVRRRIGLAGQYAAVEPTMTGRENLVMTARLFGHPTNAAKRAASIVIEQLSLEEVADRRCSTYSGVSADGWTSEQAWSARLGSSCSTSRRPAWIRRPQRSMECVRNLVAQGLTSS